MSTVREEHGVACPKCGSDEQIEVVYTSWTRLVPDGTDDDNVLDKSVEYDNESPCRCGKCGWAGKFGDGHLPEARKQCVIVDGNPFDGMTVHGPFPDPDTANAWAERYSKGGDWLNVNLNPINQE